MEEDENPEMNIEQANDHKTKKNKKKKISISTDQVIISIEKLGDRVAKLDTDGQWRSDQSLWSEVVTGLPTDLSIENTPAARKYLYTMWLRESSNVRSRFLTYPRPRKDNDATAVLESLPSIPSCTTVKTRSLGTDSSSIDIQKKNSVQSHLIEFTYEEWRHVSFITLPILFLIIIVFKMYKKGHASSESHHMELEWTSLFYNKLIESKLVTCSIVFSTSKLRKKFSRKHNAPLFRCQGRCQDKICPLKIRMIMAQPVEFGRNVIFRVKIDGTPQHDKIPSGRPLKGIQRKQMGKYFH